MKNILIQYDWNNHKELNQKRLTDLFMSLELKDRIKVYRILSDKRKVLLRKGYEKWKSEQRKLLTEKNRNYVLLPFRGLLSHEDIKTDNEVYLTLAILLYDGHIWYYEDLDANAHKEKDSFERTKNKMVSFYVTMYMREHSSMPHEDDDFYRKLRELEYCEPPTLNSFLSFKKVQWLKYYTHIGVGKERAKKIVAALSKRIKKIESYTEEESLVAMQTRFKWKERIGKEAREYAMLYYSRIEMEVEEE